MPFANCTQAIGAAIILADRLVGVPETRPLPWPEVMEWLADALVLLDREIDPCPRSLPDSDSEDEWDAGSDLENATLSPLDFRAKRARVYVADMATYIADFDASLPEVSVRNMHRLRVFANVFIGKALMARARMNEETDGDLR